MALAARNGGKPPKQSGTEWLRSQAKRVGDGEPLAVDTDIAAAVEVEAWLQARNVAYAPAAWIPMNLIDVKRSRANQARRDPIVTESVDRFAVAMRAGHHFPPIVVYPDGGKLVIIDGNNRQAAASRAGLEQIWGIVVSEETPSELIQLLTVEANARHGVTPELAWRVQQAFSLVGMGWTDQDAADAAGLSVAQLRAARSVQEADYRARNLRITGFQQMPASSKQALGAVKDDAVFTQLSRIAIDSAMTTEEIREVTRALKNLNSEQARLEHLAAVRKERTAQRAVKRAPGKHSRLTSPRIALSAGIGKIIAIDATALAKQVVTGKDRDLLVARLSEAKKKIAMLEIAMNSLTLDDE
jgi:ParB-like chromosome segregation protein Spo0J